MPEAMPTPAINPAPAAPAAQPAPQDASTQPKPEGVGHHSARQPRDEGKRFAGPPGEQAAPAPEKREPAPAAPVRLKGKYKEHGQEIEEEATPEELWEDRRKLRALQHKEQLATERLQRASNLAKESEEARIVAEALEAGDFEKVKAYYAKRGKQPVDVLAELLEKALDERDMDPKDRELAQLRADKAALEAAQTQEQEQKHSAEFMKEVERHRGELHKMWGHALEQTDLPKTPEMLETAASIFLEAVDATGGKAALSPEQVAYLTRERTVDNSKPVVNAMGLSQFFKHFGGEGGIVSRIDKDLSPEDFEKAFPELAKRYHKDLVRRVRQQPRGGAQQKLQVQPKSEPVGVEGSAVEPWLASRLGNR